MLIVELDVECGAECLLSSSTLNAELNVDVRARCLDVELNVYCLARH